jgi:hypothetical protein
MPAEIGAHEEVARPATAVTRGRHLHQGQGCTGNSLRFAGQSGVRETRAAVVIEDDLEVKGLVPPAEGPLFLGHVGPFEVDARSTAGRRFVREGIGEQVVGGVRQEHGLGSGGVAAAFLRQLSKRFTTTRKLTDNFRVKQGSLLRHTHFCWPMTAHRGECIVEALRHSPLMEPSHRSSTAWCPARSRRPARDREHRTPVPRR